MFTIKFYSADGCRQRIFSAESFTILRVPENGPSPIAPAGIVAEITLHQKSQSDDFRIDIGENPKEGPWPPVFHKAIIENASGRTTEIIVAGPMRA